MYCWCKHALKRSWQKESWKKYAKMGQFCSAARRFVVHLCAGGKCYPSTDDVPDSV